MTTCSASFSRISPWSTNTQVSCSPIASWISTAATALSTPPDRPQITLPAADLGADFGDLGLAELGHRPVAGEAADVAHEVGDQLARRRACGPPRGGTGCRSTCALSSAITAKGAPSLVATISKPGANWVTLSPWLIHTWWRSPTCHSPSNSAQGFGDGQEGAAELAAFAGLVARAHFAAELVRHHLLAVADAEDRQAAVEQHLRRAGAAFVGHAGGRARQDDALGLQPVRTPPRRRERGDLRIDPRLAHAAGDELGHLAAEIDDQDGIGEVGWLSILRR